MSLARKQMKKMQQADKSDKKVFNLKQEVKNKRLSGSEDEAKEEEPVMVEKSSKKRPSPDFEDEGACTMGNGFQSMFEQFGADISKAMQVKKKRLETLTKTYMKGSQNKLEQLWSTHQSQRQKLIQQYSEQVSATLHQWETEAQRGEEQEEKMNNLFRQQLKVLQQARAAQSQKLKVVQEMYEFFVKNMDEVQKSHETFLQGATQELRKEMNTLQKKILMDTQQQEMATVRKSLHSMLF